MKYYSQVIRVSHVSTPILQGTTLDKRDGQRQIMVWQRSLNRMEDHSERLRNWHAIDTRGGNRSVNQLHGDPTATHGHGTGDEDNDLLWKLIMPKGKRIEPCYQAGNLVNNV